MPAVACLIADPDRSPLDGRLVEEAEKALRGKQHWLGEAAAAEIATEELEPGETKARLEPLLGGLAVDLAVLSPQHRRKRLLVSDMDSTIITIECIDELADFAGIKPQIAEVTRRAMNGELDFEAALRERVALLAGLPQRAIAAVIEERLRLMPGARTLVRTMRAHGACTALVSGGFTAFTRHVQRLCGFDVEQANELEIADDRLTGRLIGEVHGSAAKLATLCSLRDRLGLADAETMAVGDGANDLPMIRAAGLGVAYHAHPRVRAQAPVRIDHGDLTALLYLQGYRRDEFVTG
ncbi:phosphoserine phosphatase SerB [Benzoatithermus flavus]|uniref:Phosphoserine phosphatase n=1 Tax=Benzoatithermus flavus TaxID=3108223 RepID=A0ABU8XLE1_9PROT